MTTSPASQLGRTWPSQCGASPAERALGRRGRGGGAGGGKPRGRGGGRGDDLTGLAARSSRASDLAGATAATAGNPKTAVARVLRVAVALRIEVGGEGAERALVGVLRGDAGAAAARLGRGAIALVTAHDGIVG